MKAIKNLFILAMLFVMIGCTGSSVVCDAGKATAAVVAVGISTSLTCSNVDAIKATLQTKLQDSALCKKSDDASLKAADKSVVGSLVCSTLINSVFAGGIAQLPPEWGCTGGGSVDDLKAKLVAACQKSI